MNDKSNIKNQSSRIQDDSLLDPFAPLTPDEQASANVVALRQRIEVLNQMQAEYLAFLKDTKKLLQDLGNGEQTVKDELAKLETRNKLDD